MGKCMKALFIASAAIVTFFLVLLVVTLISNGGRLTNRVTNTHGISDTFSRVSIETKTADVVILRSEDGVARVVCYEDPKIKNEVSVEEGTLRIKRVDTRRWYEYILFSFGKTEITVYLPETEYEALSVKASTGDITVRDTNASDLKIALSTGDVSLSGMKTGKATVTSSTGDISLKSISASGDIALTASTGNASVTDVTVSGELSIMRSTGNVTLTNTQADTFTVETDTGNVRFSASDAKEIYVVTDTGNVKGTFLTNKIFFVRTDTGRIDVPKTTVGGRCEITTDTGDIIITVD